MKALHRPSENAVNRIIKIIDSVASATCLLFVLQVITHLTSGDLSLKTDYAISYIMLAISKLMQALNARNSDKLVFVKNLCYASLFAAAAATPFIFGLDLHVMIALFIVFFFVIFTNRILSIIRNHKLRNVIFNVLIALCILYFMVGILFIKLEDQIMLLLVHAVLVAGGALCHIIFISFSQMRFNVLQKILRKTYAAEILFGLVLLIISFSFVFNALEPNMPKFTDALWYCFAVVTTIGFGDLTVASGASRVLTVILGVYGIVVVALITSVIVNFYNEIKDSNDGEKPEEPQPVQVKSASEDKDENTDQ